MPQMMKYGLIICSSLVTPIQVWLVRL